MWLYYNFCNWLNILNCTLPPVGIILVLSYFVDKEAYKEGAEEKVVDWFAVVGVILGAVVANIVPYGIASINGMAVMTICYLIGRKVNKTAKSSQLCIFRTNCGNISSWIRTFSHI